MKLGLWVRTRLPPRLRKRPCGSSWDAAALAPGVPRGRYSAGRTCLAWEAFFARTSACAGSVWRPALVPSARRCCSAAGAWRYDGACSGRRPGWSASPWRARREAPDVARRLCSPFDCSRLGESDMSMRRGPPTSSASNAASAACVAFVTSRLYRHGKSPFRSPCQSLANVQTPRRVGSALGGWMRVGYGGGAPLPAASNAPPRRTPAVLRAWRPCRGRPAPRRCRRRAPRCRRRAAPA